MVVDQGDRCQWVLRGRMGVSWGTDWRWQIRRCRLGGWGLFSVHFWAESMGLMVVDQGDRCQWVLGRGMGVNWGADLRWQIGRCRLGGCGLFCVRF